MIVKKLININNLNLNTSISGEINLNFINSLLSTIDINILSHDVKVSLNNDFKYNRLSLNKHPEIKFINLIGSYKYKEEEFRIEKLNDQPVISVKGIAVMNNLTPSARTLIIRNTVETNL